MARKSAQVCRGARVLVDGELVAQRADVTIECEVGGSADFDDWLTTGGSKRFPRDVWTVNGIEVRQVRVVEGDGATTVDIREPRANEAPELLRRLLTNDRPESPKRRSPGEVPYLSLGKDAAEDLRRQVRQTTTGEVITARRCERCGAETVLRVFGDFGQPFYGCITFPRCNWSRSAARREIRDEMERATGGVVPQPVVAAPVAAVQAALDAFPAAAQLYREVVRGGAAKPRISEQLLPPYDRGGTLTFGRAIPAPKPPPAPAGRFANLDFDDEPEK